MYMRAEEMARNRINSLALPIKGKRTYGNEKFDWVEGGGLERLAYSLWSEWRDLWSHRYEITNFEKPIMFERVEAPYLVEPCIPSEPPKEIPISPMKEELIAAMLGESPSETTRTAYVGVFAFRGSGLKETDTEVYLGVGKGNGMWTPPCILYGVDRGLPPLTRQKAGCKLLSVFAGLEIEHYRLVPTGYRRSMVMEDKTLAHALDFCILLDQKEHCREGTIEHHMTDLVVKTERQGWYNVAEVL
jgi:hypothetical protein